MSRKASIKPHRASQSKELTTIKERAQFFEELKTQEQTALKALRTQLEQAQAQSAQLAAEAKREQQQKEEALRQASEQKQQLDGKLEELQSTVRCGLRAQTRAQRRP